MDGCKTFVRPVTYNAKSMSIKTVILTRLRLGVFKGIFLRQPYL